MINGIGSMEKDCIVLIDCTTIPSSKAWALCELHAKRNPGVMFFPSHESTMALLTNPPRVWFVSIARAAGAKVDVSAMLDEYAMWIRKLYPQLDISRDVFVGSYTAPR